MKTKLFTLFLAFVISIGTIFAEAVKIGDLYYNLNTRSLTAEVTSKPETTGYVGDISIPDTITYSSKNYIVTSIGESAFSSDTRLTSITIGNNISTIGYCAFGNCKGLTSVTIPNNVTSIGKWAFRDCTNLTSVTIGNSVTSIGSGAFLGCTGLASISIPNSVTSIRSSAFSGCTGLAAIVLSNSLTCIDTCTFYGCTSLTSVTIPNSVTCIEFRAFDRCRSLKSLVMGNTVSSIGQYAFRYCSVIKSVTINSNALANMSSSLQVYFGSQVTEYIIGGDVSTIGHNSFRNCTSLTSVTIGNSVTSIGNNVFSGCTSLTSVTINSNAIMRKVYNWDASFSYIFGNQVTHYTIGDSVSSIGSCAFYGCSGMTSLTIPNSITSIGNHAFHGCSGMTSLTIPNSVTSIGDGAFYGCSGLTSITLSNRLQEIGEVSFESCANLKSISIPTSVTSIGYTAFGGCANLKTIVVPNGVSVIGDFAFARCTNLTSIQIGKNVSSIGDFILNECPNLTSIVVDSKNTMYDSRNRCNALIETATNTLLYGCKNTIIPEGILSIGDNAFYGCEGLASVNFPDSITNIGMRAFRDCANLTSVSLPNCITSIGSEAFANCTSLSSVIVPCSATDIGTKCFDGCVAIKYLSWDGCDREEKKNFFSQSISPDTIILGSHVTSENLPTAFNKGFNLEYAEINATLSDISVLRYWKAKHIVWNAKSHGKINERYQVPFSSRENVEIFEIGDSVEIIGDYLFSDLKTLSTLKIPEKISEIGKYAFKGCTNITSVRWNAINPSTSDDIFKDSKNSINSFEIGDKVTHIPDFLCDNMTMVDSIIIPQSVKQIGKAAFQNCKCITNIPDSVIEVGKCSFLGCSNLSTISSNLQFIGDSAFAGCSKLTDITFPSERLSIGSDAFLGCNIMNVYITDIAKWCSSRFPSAYIMGDHTQQIKLNGIMLFNKATKLYVNGKELHDLVIPDECSSVTGRAFESYAGLRSVTFHDGIRGIGEKSFDCPNLIKITCFATNPPSAEKMYVQRYYGESTYLYTFYVEAFPNVKNKIKLYVPQNSIETYREAKVWQNFNTILPIQNALEINEDDVKATPTANNSVIVQWPSVEQADSYIVEIWKEEDLICSFTFDSQGYLLRVSNAVRAHYGASNHSAQADHISKGWQYTIDGLEPGMQYTYTISMKDSEGIDLFSQSLLFCTYGEGLEEIKSRIKTHKIIHNGQILILRGDKMYTLRGQEMR